MAAARADASISPHRRVNPVAPRFALLDLSVCAVFGEPWAGVECAEPVATGVKAYFEVPGAAGDLLGGARVDPRARAAGEEEREEEREDAKGLHPAAAVRGTRIEKQIGFNTDYAAAVHEGTDVNHQYPGAVNPKAQPKFLETAMRNNVKRVSQIVADAIRSEL